MISTMGLTPGAGGSNSSAQTLLLIGFGILVATMLLWRVNARRRNSRRISNLKARSPRNVGDARQINDARDEMNMLMLKLAELSREICGQIDTRFAKLEHAINEADRKIAQLNRALAEARRAAATQPSEPCDPRHEKIYALAQDGRSHIEIAREMAMPVGEIELILSLERNRRNNRTAGHDADDDRREPPTASRQDAEGPDDDRPAPPPHLDARA